MGFSIRPVPDFVSLANAGWHPKPTPGVDNNMEAFAQWCRTTLHLVVNRYFSLSSFAFARRGYLELGCYDEVLNPAPAEDVEYHIKAASKGEWASSASS